jgi:uncharacterized protein YfaS (alpha-2-macroglobulin family)
MSRGHLLWGLLGLSLVLFAGAAGATVLQDPSGERESALPTDPGKLLEYARNQMNRGAWKEADRAFKSYLERFPDGKEVETTLYSLAHLHVWYSHKHAEGREFYSKLCTQFLKSPMYWNYRFELAHSYSYQNLREKAIEELAKIAKEAPDPAVRTNAIQQGWGLRGKHFYMHVNQTFTAGQEPAVSVQLQSIDKVAFRATYIRYDSILERLGTAQSMNLHDALSKVEKEARTVLREWTAEYPADQRKSWRQEEVKVPSTRSGVYIVEGEHEGVVLSVTLFVSKYGLLTKAAAGKLLCFAQDRATSKPVEGMTVRVVSPDHPLEGRTDREGLFLAQGYRGGLVVGIKDQEIVTTESHYTELPGEHPLVYITTDRPIYRPRQEVQFHIVHRLESGEKLELRPGRAMIVEIHDPKGNKVFEERRELGPFGSTEGTFVLGDEPALGEYTITTRSPEGEEAPNPWAWRWGYGQGGNHGQFRVDEYRKPEYKVEVTFQKSPVLQGDMIRASIEAAYYFGSPVADAEVTYTVHRRGYWSMWRSWAYYYDWYSDENEERLEGKRHAYWWGLGEQVLQGTGKTGPDGKLAVEFASQKWTSDAVYTLVAKVTDLSRRAVEAQGTCKATQAEFGLAMTLNKYVYKPGDRMNIKVRAATAEDKVVSEVPLVLRGYDRRWENGKSHDEQLFEGTSKTDELGMAEFDFTPQREGGYLYLVAEAQDRLKNRVTAEHWVWLCGGNWYGDTVNLNGVDLIPDRKTYNLGDTAQLLVTSQFKNVALLLTVEGREIYRHEVIVLKGHTRVVELKIDRSLYAPNVFVGIAAIKENQIVQRQRMLVVNPSEKFVTVEVKPDRKEYRPRGKAVYQILTKGADGRPVSAEVTLGLVDESIYALQDEYALDIRRHFIHRIQDGVLTSSSLYYYDYGRADEKNLKEERAGGGGRPGHEAQDAAAAPAPGAQLAARKAAPADKGKAGGGYAATEIRSNFADTVLFRTLKTDSEGRAVLEVVLPDNLTTWRATARAVTADSRFGQTTSDILVRKNVIVRLETPRFFTQNDETVISAIAHNYLPSGKDVKVEFSVEGLDVEGPKEALLQVPPDGQKRLDWKAKALKAGRSRITVKALTDEDSDAMELVVPVRPHGAMKWDSKGGLVEGKVVETITIPEGSVNGGSELMIVVSPTHASMVLDALDYLAGYPYGCVEQTMSRFLPTLVVSQALEKLKLENRELKAELPAMISAGLQRLYNFQHSDGGWGWWEHDQTNPWITAYVIFGLSMARELDHPVEPAVISRGIQALQGQLEAASEDPNLQVYLLYALSQAGVRSEAIRDRLAGRPEALGAFGKAMLALVLHKDQKDAGSLLASLVREAKIVAGAAHFEGGSAGRWMDHPSEVTAIALRALLKIDPRHELVPKVVHWLSAAREGNYWASTRQTAMVVFALTDYLAFSGDMNPDMTIGLSVNGDPIFSERVTRENWQKFKGQRRIPAEKLRPGENVITLEKTGNGTPAYSIYAKYYAEAEDLKPSLGGIQVERTYSRVLFEKGQRILQRLESGSTVTSGDELEVVLTVTADQNYEWLMMEDPLPSGFEPIREDWSFAGWRWNYWYSRKEFHDDRVSIAMTRLGQGRHTASYQMRAETPGDFHALPAGVWNMYHPQIGGNSAEFRIKVVDRKP